MLKQVTKFLLVAAASFLTMILIAVFIPSLQTNFYGFATYAVPLILATCSVAVKFSPLWREKESSMSIFDLSTLSPEESEQQSITSPAPTYNLEALLRDEGVQPIETMEQYQDFLDSHTLVKSFVTKVVGVSYDNDDGSSRQEILSRCLRGEPVGLHSYTFNGQPALAVISEHGQIGHLRQDLAADIDNKYGDNIIFSATINDITGGDNGLHYGCFINLSIYVPKQANYAPSSKPFQDHTDASCPIATPAEPAVDVSTWNEEIPTADLLELVMRKPYYDNYLMRCTADGCAELPQRFSDLHRFVVVDIETTGLSPQKDKIIEIAAVKFENFQAVGTFSTLINPQIPIPQRITELTGITQVDVCLAPTWQEKMLEFVQFIWNYPLVGHNITSFDIRFIENAIGKELPNPLIDTLDYSRTVFPVFPTHKLSYLKEALFINVDTSHRALDDVKTTFFLLAACMRQDSCLESACNDTSTLTENKGNYYIPPVPQKTNYKNKKKTSTKDIVPSCSDIDASNPLYGKRIVFTGELSIARKDAMQLAVNRGALIRTTVSSKTDLLVVGIQNPDIVGPDGLSTKEERARFLNGSKSAGIQIINEEKFFELIDCK